MASLTLCYGPEQVYLSELSELRNPDQLSAKVSELNALYDLKAVIPFNSSAFTRLMETVGRGAIIISNNRRSDDGHVIGIVPSWKVDDGIVTKERVYYVVDTAASRSNLLETDSEGLSALYTEASLTSTGQRAILVLLDAKTTTTSGVEDAAAMF